jgi:hypothetical protein
LFLQSVDLDESQSEVTSSSNKPDLGKGKVEAASSDGSLMGSTDSASKGSCVASLYYKGCFGFVHIMYYFLLYIDTYMMIFEKRYLYDICFLCRMAHLIHNPTNSKGKEVS